MHVLIFEGMPTSGKSTIIKTLQQQLKSQVFSEDQTHEPIMNDTSNTHLPFFHSLLSKIDKEFELVIFDRLYLTQAFRCGVNLDSYAEIEQELLASNPMTIFLEVDEDAIEERIMESAKQRGGDWEEYFRTKGKTPEEIAEFYIKQQRSQMELLKRSLIPHEIFNTTNHGYEKIAADITKLIAE